ncbi:Lrp/AsnC family transcriptional regulator, partial [Chloroflexota bacterium]
MDDLDRKLLSELQRRGYQKSTVLAIKLGIGERTIRRRISAMRSKGIIKIIAVPKPVGAGCRAWAKIGIKVEPGSLFKVAQELIENPSVYFVAYSLGIFEIMIAVRFGTMDGLTYFVNSELTRIKGITGTEAMMLMYPRKYYDFRWPEYIFTKNNGREYYHDAIELSSGYETDDMDHKIIDFLSEDALTPVHVLSSRLGTGKGTIQKRIKRMLKEEIFKLEVVPNPESLEYEVWATMGLNINHQFTDEVINAIIKNPAVYLAAVSLGRFNIVISIHFHNIDLLNEFIHVEMEQIPGISAKEIFVHTKPLKYHNT